MRYFVVGAATASFAAGVVDDPALYASDYPHLSDAYRLQAHRREIDQGAFDTGLDALIAGLELRFQPYADAAAGTAAADAADTPIVTPHQTRPTG